MKIELHQIPIKDIVKGYEDKNEEGVYGYDGKLNIRPKYQREFIYKEEQRNAVIDTVFKGFPLNVMYWNLNDDGTYEVLDGQQRTISICQYVAGEFSVQLNGATKYYHNLTDTQKNAFLDYNLMIYFCEGTTDERLAWFRIINIAGEKLTEQELRNASYTGPWLTSAKSIFSKTGCAAYSLANKYVNGSPIRQELLETALNWKSKGKIEEYMAQHQNDPNANELWLYFQNVINWIPTVFSKPRKEMKGLPWGPIYNEYHDKRDDKGNPIIYDTDKIEEEVAKLMMDDDVSKKSGIYQYILSKEEKYLNIRAFTDTMKRAAFERQNGVCPLCKKTFNLDEMEADHITPWSQGGKTNAENCQMLCKACNRTKSDH